MEATIELYEPLYDHLKTVSKSGRRRSFKWVVRFGAVVRICPSERSAYNYLYRMGFRMDDNVKFWKTNKSDEEINLENNYRKVL